MKIAGANTGSTHDDASSTKGRALGGIGDTRIVSDIDDKCAIVMRIAGTNEPQGSARVTAPGANAAATSTRPVAAKAAPAAVTKPIDNRTDSEPRDRIGCRRPTASIPAAQPITDPINASSYEVPALSACRRLIPAANARVAAGQAITQSRAQKHSGFALVSSARTDRSSLDRSTRSLVSAERWRVQVLLRQLLPSIAAGVHPVDSSDFRKRVAVPSSRCSTSKRSRA